MLLCLVVCLTLLASFFLPSHLSLKHVHVHVHAHVHDSTHVHVHDSPVEILESLPLLHAGMQWKWVEFEELQQRAQLLEGANGIDEDESSTGKEEQKIVEVGILKMNMREGTKHRGVHVYMCIEREREREKRGCKNENERERDGEREEKHTFSSAEHMILVSVSVATVPLCLLRSTTAASCLRPTCEMRVSGGRGRVEEGRRGEGRRVEGRRGERS